MNAREFFDAVAKMRHAQKQYFATRSKEWLVESKDSEKKVDAEVSRVNAVWAMKGGEK